MVWTATLARAAHLATVTLAERATGHGQPGRYVVELPEGLAQHALAVGGVVESAALDHIERDAVLNETLHSYAVKVGFEDLQIRLIGRDDSHGATLIERKVHQHIVLPRMETAHAEHRHVLAALETVD